MKFSFVKNDTTTYWDEIYLNEEEFIRRASKGHFSKGDVLQDLSGECYFVDGFEINRCYGDIYTVTHNNQVKHMVWYQEEDNFSEKYQKLCSDVESGSPEKMMFIWPESVLKNIERSFGYIVPMTDEESGVDCYKLGESPSSLKILLTACKNVAIAFKHLHVRGLCLRNFDVSDFLFDKNTGNLKINNYENVGIISSKTDYYIDRLFAAPEIVEGDNHINEATDRFILAVILFRLLITGHPFEGSKIWTLFPEFRGPAYNTQEMAKAIYGKNAVFVFDYFNESNRPVDNHQDEMIYRWSKMPDLIKELFRMAFSEDAIKNPILRTTEDLWISAFDSYIR